jgi:hypothetical protein
MGVGIPVVLYGTKEVEAESLANQSMYTSEICEDAVPWMELRRRDLIIIIADSHLSVASLCKHKNLVREYLHNPP